MWYQRIEEIANTDSQPPATPPRLPKNGDSFPQRVTQKRKLETSIAEDTLSCFKRVRLLQRNYDRGVESDGPGWGDADWDDTDSDNADSDDADWDEADFRQEMARIREENEELRRQSEIQESQTASLLRQLQELQTVAAVGIECDSPEGDSAPVSMACLVAEVAKRELTTVCSSWSCRKSDAVWDS